MEQIGEDGSTCMDRLQVTAKASMPFFAILALDHGYSRLHGGHFSWYVTV